MILYKSIIGSRLYGTYREDSDYDYIEVYSENIATHQEIFKNIDITRMSLSSFMYRAGEGAHQIVEAMFNPDRQDIDMFYDMRRKFYPDTAKTVNLYRRTIYKFGDHKMRKRDKAMQTALRMTYNLEEFLEKGRFNPVLDAELASVLPCMSWQEAHDETFKRMNILSERHNL